MMQKFQAQNFLKANRDTKIASGGDDKVLRKFLKQQRTLSGI